MESIDPAWGPAKRIGFRFFFALACLHLALVLLPSLLWILPLPDAVGQFWFDRVIMGFWWPAARWVQRDVFHISPAPYVDSEPTAPMHELVGIICIVVLSVAITALWSYIDRRRSDYRRLHEWFRAYLRYSTGMLLLSYGLRKVYLEQFGAAPSVSALMTPTGLLNQFGILSVYMAASPIYQMFTGIVEVLAGVLLMIRRTSRVGAFLAVAVMTNVVVLNFAYHFTMYLLSIGMLTMAALLVAPELPRLAALLLLDRPVEAPARRPLFANQRLNTLSGALGVLILLSVGANLVHKKAAAYKRSGLTPPLYGAYEVQSVERNGAALSPLLTDGSIWRRLTVDRSFGTVAFARDTVRFVVKADTAHSMVTFIFGRDPKRSSQWSYMRPDADHLVLAGVDDLHRLSAPRQASSQTGADNNDLGVGALQPGDSIRVMLRRIDLHALPLLRSQPWFR